MRPARASKETSSAAGGRSLRGLLVSPKAWITRSKIARYIRFFGHPEVRLGQDRHPRPDCVRVAFRARRGPRQARMAGPPVTPRGAASGG
ncbi:hypothetical protein GCM10010228_59810 [Streptomyces massasporeus]|nr:hypothetical protein GCM10010228_59810 [Streptomyces massasporeus]